MKKQMTRALAVCGVLLMLAAGGTTAARAQVSRRIIVEVPFDFVVAEKRLPAGRYTVRAVTRDSSKALLLRSEDGRAAATFLTNGGRRAGVPERPQLVFRQYGARLFLAQVWMPVEGGFRELPASKLERELRRELRERARGADTTAEGEAEVKTVTIVGGGAR